MKEKNNRRHRKVFQYEREHFLNLIKIITCPVGREEEMRMKLNKVYSLQSCIYHVCILQNVLSYMLYLNLKPLFPLMAGKKTKLVIQRQ